MQFRTPHSHDNTDWSNQFGLACTEPTLAQQQFKDSSDINVLFGKYLETGEMPQVQDGLTFGNFEGIFDFQSAMNAVRTAEGLFSQMPARIKNRFDNDPQKLLEFLANDENREEAEFLKLVEPKQEPQNDTRNSGVAETRKDPAKAPGGAQGAQGEASKASQP